MKRGNSVALDSVPPNSFLWARLNVVRRRNDRQNGILNPFRLLVAIGHPEQTPDRIAQLAAVTVPGYFKPDQIRVAANVLL
jgi:hypothetical protein